MVNDFLVCPTGKFPGQTEILVVYHLHGQTIQFMVWVNGSQSSGVVNFVPESPLPFVQISSIYPKNGCGGLKLVSKMALKEWNTNCRLEYSIRNNRTTFSDVPLLRKLSVGTTQKVVFHLFSNGISRKIFVNRKQPLKRLSRFPDWDVPNGNWFTIYHFLEFRTSFML